MGWVEDEKERDSEAVRANVAHHAGKAECHPRKIHSNENANAEGLSTMNLQMLELELENLRLTRLVADLLLKNQRLRTSN